MKDADSIESLFDSLLENKLEKRIMELIIRGDEPEQIIDEILSSDKEVEE